MIDPVCCFYQLMYFVMRLMGERDVGNVEAAWLERKYDATQLGFASNYLFNY